MYYKKNIVLAGLCMMLIGTISHAKVKAITSRRSFEQSVARETLVAVLFYEGQYKGRSLPQDIKSLMRMYEDVSDYQPYNDADVIFLKVNVGRAELRELASLYGITTTPAFIFFSNGKRLADKQGKAVALTGNVVRDDVQSFIDKHYGIQIKKYIAQKDDREKLRLEEENESWREYFYPRTINVPSYSPAERSME